MLHSLSDLEDWVVAVAWSPDGSSLAAACRNGIVLLMPLGGSPTSTLQVQGGEVTGLSWSPDGTRLAFATEAGFIELWDLKAQPPQPVGRLYNAPGNSGFAATSDGFVSGSQKALETIRFGDGWALYDLTDLPERCAPARVRDTICFGQGWSQVDLNEISAEA